MTKQFKILVATDYSKQAMNAERYAVQFAQMTNSKLTILHVYSVPMNLPAARTEFARATERLRKNELLRLEQHCVELFRSLKVSRDSVQYECMVLEGSATSRIQREAHSLQADIIITGPHSTKGFWDSFRVNHNWDLLKSSDVPVLTVPEEANLNEIKRIVFATEYREGEIPGVRFLAQVAKSFSAELIILNVTTHMLTKEFEKALRDNFLDQMKDHDSGNIHTRVIHADDIVQGINDYCTSARADWLVMTHSRSIAEKLLLPVKSITKEMSGHTHIPLLALPDFYTSGNDTSS